jgi:hypothetical protein
MADMDFGSIGGASGPAGGVLSGTYPQPALVSESGTLGADVEVLAETTVLTVASLAVGMWLIHANITVEQETLSTPTIWSCRVNGGTATYTVTGGNTSTQIDTPSLGTAANQSGEMSLSFVVNVTVVGTVVITALGSTGTPYAKASTSANAYANATGYTALRVA